MSARSGDEIADLADLRARIYAPDPVPLTFTLAITLGEGMQTPNDVLEAIASSLYKFGYDNLGTMVSFTEQPSEVYGAVHSLRDTNGNTVGSWAVQ